MSLADVQYLTLVARGPAVIVVGKKVAANNLADLIKLAKASPGKLNYGSAGPAPRRTSAPNCSSKRPASTSRTCHTRVPHRQ